MIWNVDENESEASDVPTSGSNVRKDLNEFQEKHANLVLTTVKVNSDYIFYILLLFCICVIICIIYCDYFIMHFTSHGYFSKVRSKFGCE